MIANNSINANDPEIHSRLEVLNLQPEPCVITSADRIVVWTNPAFDNMCARLLLKSQTGVTLDKIFQCRNSNNMGVSSICSNCAVYLAAIEKERNKTTTNTGRLTSVYPWGSRDLTVRIHSTLVNWGGTDYRLLFLQNRINADNSYDINRNFFHDLLNICQRMRSAVNMSTMRLSDSSANGIDIPLQLFDDIKQINDNIDGIIGQVTLMRQLNNAQHDTLTPYIEEFSIQENLQEAIDIFNARTLSEPRLCILSPEAEPIQCRGDKLLICAMTYSMIQTMAYTGAAKGITVLGYDSQGEELVIWLHNRELVLKEKQIAKFGLDFTTKRQRNLPSYAADLLHSFLRGRFELTSTAEEGTKLSFIIPRQFPADAAQTKA